MSIPISIESTVWGLREVINDLEKIKKAGSIDHSQGFFDLADSLETYRQRLLIFGVIAASEAEKRGH